VGVFFLAELGVADVPFVGISWLSAFVLSDVSLVGVLLVSVGMSLLRCNGVRVSRVVGELSFNACGVSQSQSQFFHSSLMRVRFAGVLAVEEAATSSSGGRFVCENNSDVTM
jgi:hypothetical protein